MTDAAVIRIWLIVVVGLVLCVALVVGGWMWADYLYVTGGYCQDWVKCPPVPLIPPTWVQ
jgi:DNA-binding transcriptional regulator of glucitol operon